MLIRSLCIPAFCTQLQDVWEQSPPKTFWNIFTSVKSFYEKFCQFVGSSYSHTNFCRFIIVCHQNLRGWKRWVLVEKLTPFDEIPVLRIGRYMWIWIANKFAEFHAKRLNRSENIPKSFRRATVLETPGISYFYRASQQHLLTRDIDTGILSVRPSRSGVASKRLKISSYFLHRIMV